MNTVGHAYDLQMMESIHWTQVAAIYQAGIDTGNATLETSVPTWDAWDKAHIPHCRFVAMDNDIVAGWSALTPVSGRCVYAGVAEVSVYIHPAYQGKGIGKKLLEQLVISSEAQGLWTLQAGILRENIASLKLHAACGFREIGYREKLGQYRGIWRDVVLMERRSKKVGH